MELSARRGDFYTAVEKVNKVNNIFEVFKKSIF